MASHVLTIEQEQDGRLSYLSMNVPAPRPEKVKQRKVSPRSETFIKLYDEAARSALQTSESPQERIKHCERLLLYDQFIQQNTFLRCSPTEEQQKLQDMLLKLKRLEYYARYGDYLGRSAREMKEVAKGNKDIEPVLKQYWTKIQRQLKQEHVILDRLKYPTQEDVPTHYALWTLARDLNIPSDHVEWSIECYAERNKLFHPGIDEMIQNRQFDDLARVLSQDLHDVERSLPIDKKDDIAKMTALILRLQDKFFNVVKGDEDHPAAWGRTDEMVQLSAQCRNDPTSWQRQKHELIRELHEKALARKRHYAGLAISGKRMRLRSPMDDEEKQKRLYDGEKMVGISEQCEEKAAQLRELYDKRDGAFLRFVTGEELEPTDKAKPIEEASPTEEAFSIGDTFFAHGGDDMEDGSQRTSESPAA